MPADLYYPCDWCIALIVGHNGATMRLIIWILGSVFMAIAVVQLVIEGMFAAFGGSWTRLLTLRDLSTLLAGPGSGDWMPGGLASLPPWIFAGLIGAVLLYLGRYRRRRTP